MNRVKNATYLSAIHLFADQFGQTLLQKSSPNVFGKGQNYDKPEST